MSNESRDFADNMKLIEYLKIRKEAQTEIEIKNIMNKIYESIVKNSKLIYAFSSSIEPKLNENGEEEFDALALIKPALIYSDRAQPYLPVYTSFEESQNRSTKEQFPYLKQVDFIKLSSMVLDSNGAIEGIVLNPFSDNLVLNKSKVQYMSSMNKGQEVQVGQNQSKGEDGQNRTLSKASVTSNSGVYTKNAGAKKKIGILVNEYDLRILEYNVLPTRVMKTAISFAKENYAITAMWVFDKRYYLPNDNTQYLAQLFVVEDNLENEEERALLYQKLKDVTMPDSNATEIHVESIENQAKDFIRKNAVIPFYQKINVQGEYKKEEVV